MPGDLLLGIDIGTYSAKGVLATPAGEIVAEATVEHDLSLPRPGWAEHDADAVWWGGLVALCRQLLPGRGDQVGAVAVSGIGPCLLPVDRQGKALRPAILYGIDSRAGDEIAWFNERYGSNAISALGGMTLSSQSVGPKILWLRRHEPEIWAKTATLHTCSSYLIQKLTGEVVMDRHTASYASPFFDIQRLEWDLRFADDVVEAEKLPRLVWSNDIVGAVTDAASAETGLPVGTPAAGGTIDAVAEAISVGVTEPGQMMVMYGSTMFFVLITDEPVPDPRMWTTAFCLPGLFDIEGGLSTSGALTRWFRDEFGALELPAGRRGEGNAYALLAELAATVPAGADGLICLPYFAGERTPIQDPDARGAFVGLTLRHSRAHLYRAVLEGTAFGVRHNLETMEAMGAHPSQLVAVGGGAKNQTWLQIVTDVTGVPQLIPERTVGAAYGDAFLAGLAAGIIPDRAVLQHDWVRASAVLEPNPEHRETYNHLYAVYRALYPAMRESMHALAAFQRDG